MAKEDMNKEPIVDALTPLKGTFFLHGAVVVKREYCDIKNDKRDPNLVTGHYWQLVLSDTKTIINCTTGDKPEAFGSICEPLVQRYDIGFNFDGSKGGENDYRFKIVDFKKSLKS